MFVDKPDKVLINPEPKPNYGKLTVKEGDTVGPYKCFADCNPPCSFTWKYQDTDGSLHNASSDGQMLSVQRVYRNVSFLRCVAIYEQTDGKTRNIELDIQCKYFSILFYKCYTIELLK